MDEDDVLEISRVQADGVQFVAGVTRLDVDGEDLQPRTQ